MRVLIRVFILLLLFAIIVIVTIIPKLLSLLYYWGSPDGLTEDEEDYITCVSGLCINIVGTLD